MKITFDPRGIDDGFTLFPPLPTFKQWDPSGKFREASVTWPLSFKAMAMTPMKGNTI